MSLRDLATLAIRARQDFPEYRSYFAIPRYTYRGVTEDNHNHLLKTYPGTTGMKTGFTAIGKYGVVVTVTKGNRNLVGVVNGARTRGLRDRIAAQLLDYGFEKYKKIRLITKDQTVASLQVTLGEKDKVAVVTNRDIDITMPLNQGLDSISMNVKYQKPLSAPINLEDKIGSVEIKVANKVTGRQRKFEYDLFAKEKVDKVKPFQRLRDSIKSKLQENAEALYETNNSQGN
jgi:D-alanyl-D-alanine carboxypeptidase (penicillin-binding protein 5/6)